MKWAHLLDLPAKVAVTVMIHNLPFLNFFFRDIVLSWVNIPPKFISPKLQNTTILKIEVLHMYQLLDYHGHNSSDPCS